MIFVNILLVLLNILLWIFLILLSLLILLLIIPIGYRVEGKIGEQTKITAKVSWFFNLFRMRYAYESEKSQASTFAIKIGFYNVPVDSLSSDKFMKKDKPKDEDKKGFSMSFSDAKEKMEKLDIHSIVSLGIMLIRKLCKKIAPKRLMVQGTVGLKDPCATGQFIGFYEAAAGAVGLRHSIDLAGDFNQKILALNLKLAGRFAIASLLWPFIWFILQKPVRNGIKIMKSKAA